MQGMTRHHSLKKSAGRDDVVDGRARAVISVTVERRAGREVRRERDQLVDLTPFPCTSGGLVLNRASVIADDILPSINVLVEAEAVVQVTKQ
jgi:hypothetical protein